MILSKFVPVFLLFGIALNIVHTSSTKSNLAANSNETSNIFNWHSANNNNRTKPNLILFLVDDFGYGDLSCFGHPTQEPGYLDQLAVEGMRLTQMYASASLCTPSRASLLTGRQPFRTGLTGPSLVHMPFHPGGLPLHELTLPELLQQQGYKTGMVGKWHLGTNEHTSTDGTYLPHNHGFDFVGNILPFSLASWCDTDKRYASKPNRNFCYLYRGETIIQQPIDLASLTPSLVNDAKAFIQESADEPFFLYFSFPQTHTPMYNMPQFRGKSKRGLYGDQVNEVAWAVEEVMSMVKSLHLTEDTLTLFTSDHGPHIEMCQWSGHAGPFADGKTSYKEGGLRVSGILHWPGVIPESSVSSEVISLMDILPSFVDLAGGAVPNDRIIDGKSFINQIISGHFNTTAGTSLTDSSQVHDILFFYSSTDDVLVGARYKQFKIYFMSQPNISKEEYMRHCKNGKPVIDLYSAALEHGMNALDKPLIYNVNIDISEREALDPNDYQDILSDVYRLLEKEKQTWYDKRSQYLQFNNVAPSLMPCCNQPYCFCNYGVDSFLSSLATCPLNSSGSKWVNSTNSIKCGELN